MDIRTCASAILCLFSLGSFEVTEVELSKLEVLDTGHRKYRFSIGLDFFDLVDLAISRRPKTLLGVARQLVAEEPNLFDRKALVSACC